MLTMASQNNRLRALVLQWGWLVPTLLCGCMGNTSHLAFSSISAEGWSDTTTLHYTLMPPPELNSLPRTKDVEHGISVLFHTEEYAYRNIAFHITIKQDTTLHDKQHTFMLSEGKPVKGIGGRRDYSFPIDNIVYNDTLPLMIDLQHSMDTPLLHGIRSVGILIGECNREPDEVLWKVQW